MGSYTNILGIDPGTANIGIVIIDNYGVVLYKECWKPPNKGVERLLWVGDELAKLVDKYKIRDAAIEGYSYMSKWRAHDLGEVGGIIRVSLHEMGVRYSVVPPPTLKKFVTGKGNTKKELVPMHVFKKWGEEFEDTHTCDAYSLCRYILEEGYRDE